MSLFIVFCFCIVCALTAPAPPVWPNAYSIKANESSYKYNGNGKNRTLIWESTLQQYYDYTNKRMRYDRSPGNQDGMCMNHVNTSMQCNMYFDESGALFLNYPSINKCCKACPVGVYCTVIKPTWMQNGTYDGTKNMNGRQCDEWQIQGDQMNYWSQDSKAVPCELSVKDYPEKAGDEELQWSFLPETYVVSEPDPSLFVLPSSQCQRLCEL
eukprot:474155_1